MSDSDPKMSIESYFELVGVPESATDEDVATARSKMLGDYGGTLPEELECAFGLLSEPGYRAVYFEALQHSKTMDLVDAPPDVDAAKRFAESHHFQLQLIGGGRFIRYVNIGLPAAPAPPTSPHTSPSIVVPIIQGVPSRGGPNMSYFEILGVDQNIKPAWKLQKALYDAVAELKVAYGDVLPEEFMPAISCLLEEEYRNPYMDLLRYAETGESVDCVNASIADLRAKAAEGMHFQAIRVSDRELAYRNIGIPDPPGPPPPDTLTERPEVTQRTDAQQRKPVEVRPVAAQRSAPPVRKDSYGRVNGKIPPLALGTRVFDFELDWLNLQYAQRVRKNRFLDYMHLSWRMIHDPSQRVFSHADFLARFYHDHAYTVGANYLRVGLRDTADSSYYGACFMRQGNSDDITIVHSFAGLFRVWPWPGTIERWNEYFPDQPFPPESFFGTTPDTYSKENVALAVKYVREVNYWTLCRISDFEVPAARVRSIADQCVPACLKPWGFKSKHLRPHGMKAP